MDVTCCKRVTEASSDNIVLKSYPYTQHICVFQQSWNNINNINSVKLFVKLPSCHLDSLGERHANRLMSWVRLYNWGAVVATVINIPLQKRWENFWLDKQLFTSQRDIRNWFTAHLSYQHSIKPKMYATWLTSVLKRRVSAQLHDKQHIYGSYWRKSFLYTLYETTIPKNSQNLHCNLAYTVKFTSAISSCVKCADSNFKVPNIKPKVTTLCIISCDPNRWPGNSRWSSNTYSLWW